MANLLGAVIVIALLLMVGCFCVITILYTIDQVKEMREEWRRRKRNGRTDKA